MGLEAKLGRKNIHDIGQLSVLQKPIRTFGEKFEVMTKRGEQSIAIIDGHLVMEMNARI